MTRELMQRELVVDLAAGEFQILPVSDPRIVGPVDYGWVRYDDERRRTGRADSEILTWGGGPLAASRIPGTRRLVFTGYSPAWEGFWSSVSAPTNGSPPAPTGTNCAPASPRRSRPGQMPSKISAHPVPQRGQT